ncbi:nitronate monooxygenase [Cryobacterium mesophilum]|uniref:Propionate 3-nitronate monooxygenase n=1 Tax=Terrimesophilobacter mesophilus TaxID=433647 RepID=A0A4R8V7W5_9MICO|nr:nitronate monooxygenase [Terrimesophilobacter mesophilus]MBB5632387.1 nitronate monooxygenase [Terrimesophilobacter mesophilus]TFB79224.1 nitronate monooxygenase [Terrimesophilobacter mesophilus]
MDSWTDTAFTRVLDIELPIVLGPMGGASSVELVATVSNAGGLGSYGAYGLSGERILSVAAGIRELTEEPFSLNIWIPRDGGDDYQPDEEEFARHLAPLAGWFEELGVPLPTRPERLLPGHDEQVEAVLEARPAAMSFVFGAPDPGILDRARELGITTMGTASTVAEARFLEEQGVDVIVASGLEAGGHRVAFIKPVEESLIGNLALIPQVADAVDIPVVAAGGIADGRGVAAAMTLGADAVQLGTAFLATDESAASAPHRAMLWSEEAETTTLTRAFSGRLARGIPNAMSRAADAGELPIAPFPLQGWLLGKLKAAAIEQGRTDLFSLWAGQSASLLRHHDATDLIRALVEDAGNRLP